MVKTRIVLNSHLGSWSIPINCDFATYWYFLAQFGSVGSPYHWIIVMFDI